MPTNPWAAPPQQNPQTPGQPRSFGTPGFHAPSGRPQRRAAPARPEEIHARLDAREAQLKEELKKIQAVRTLMPQAPKPTAGAGQRPNTRGSNPILNAQIDKMSR